MNRIFFISVLWKGLGAVLEVLLQVFLTNTLGVDGYGTYAAWINGADLVYWVCFSGIVKCNTFYLSGKDASIRGFKQKYYSRYVVPALIALGAVLALAGRGRMGFWVAAIAGLELVALDRSSTLIARGQAARSLIGEYVLGRAVLLVGALVLGLTGHLETGSLLGLYGLQYLAVTGFFLGRRREAARQDISGEVRLKKWASFQWADILNAMISQLPVVLQYAFTGAFDAGVVSIVLLVKKLINFISGPAAKIFLPEFSRAYRAGDRDGLRRSFGDIMGLQMLFAGPLAVVLLGFPRILLGILARELTDYAGVLMCCSCVFLLAATLGPCGGFLQMTGGEKTDNRIRQAAMGVMALVMLIFSQDRYFVLYGLCAETAVEAGGKFIAVCRWFGTAPAGGKRYARWWVLPGAVICAVRLLGLGESPWAMVLCAGGTFLAELLLNTHK